MRFTKVSKSQGTRAHIWILRQFWKDAGRYVLRLFIWRFEHSRTKMSYVAEQSVGITDDLIFMSVPSASPKLWMCWFYTLLNRFGYHLTWSSDKLVKSIDKIRSKTLGCLWRHEKGMIEERILTGSKGSRRSDGSKAGAQTLRQRTNVTRF